MIKSTWKYEAKKEDIGPIKVFIVSEQGEKETLINVGYHSPDGFQMGYAGSGPADLAYSILIDYYIRQGSGVVIDMYELKKKVEILHRQFKNDFIVGAKKFLNIDSNAIKLWLDLQEDIHV